MKLSQMVGTVKIVNVKDVTIEDEFEFNANETFGTLIKIRLKTNTLTA